MSETRQDVQFFVAHLFSYDFVRRPSLLAILNPLGYSFWRIERNSRSFNRGTDRSDEGQSSSSARLDDVDPHTNLPRFVRPLPGFRFPTGRIDQMPIFFMLAHLFLRTSELAVGLAARELLGSTRSWRRFHSFR